MSAMNGNATTQVPVIAPPPLPARSRNSTGQSYRDAVDTKPAMAPVVSSNPQGTALGNGVDAGRDDPRANDTLMASDPTESARPAAERLGDTRVTFSDNSIDAEDFFDDSRQMRELEIEGEEKREGWDNKVQFLMGVISYAVGLGNVWRFPYLCQQNGGGAFLIPYIVMMFLEGMPLFLIEMGIGQKMRLGPVGLWNSIHPYLGGVGISSAVVSFFVGLYYNVIITWCLYYLFHSFQNPLPWAECPSKPLDGAETTPEGALQLAEYKECTNENSSSTAWFWYRRAIDTTSSIEDLGGLNYSMTACLILAWLIVWLCIMRGIKSSGKVMYLTATFPYFVTTIFLIRGVMLPGAKEGILYMITPNIKKLIDPRVWLDAATQIFYSMGLAFGGLIAFSSYNPQHNNVVRDVYILSAANLFTSLYTAVVIFSVLGFKGLMTFEKCIQGNIARIHEWSMFDNFTSKGAMETNLSIAEFKAYASVNFSHLPFAESGVLQTLHHCDFHQAISDAAEGTGLAFIVFTQAMVEFPFAPFWAVMFFLMLLMLGLGSMFGTLEGVITSIYDLKLFPWMKKPVLTAILCGFSLCIGLIFSTRAGEYYVKLFDAFAGSYGLMSVAFFEVIGVVYVYGWERFAKDIKWMTGITLSSYWTYMWRFATPLIMLTLFVSSAVLTFLNSASYFAYYEDVGHTKATDYPVWSLFIAGGIVMATILPVPFVFFVRYFRIWGLEGDIPAVCAAVLPCVETGSEPANDDDDITSMTEEERGQRYDKGRRQSVEFKLASQMNEHAGGHKESVMSIERLARSMPKIGM